MSTIPPAADAVDIEARLKALLGMEICRIVEDLENRETWLVELWSRHRDRGPFLDSVFSRWKNLDIRDLMLLDTETVASVEEFYRELDEFRLYLSFTQDMPTALSDQYTEFLQRLAAYGAQAIASLGGAPERPLIEFSEEDDDPPTLTTTDRPSAFSDAPPGTERQVDLAGPAPILPGETEEDTGDAPTDEPSDAATR